MYLNILYCYILLCFKLLSFYIPGSLAGIICWSFRIAVAVAAAGVHDALGQQVDHAHARRAPRTADGLDVAARSHMPDAPSI